MATVKTTKKASLPAGKRVSKLTTPTPAMAKMGGKMKMKKKMC